MIVYLCGCLAFELICGVPHHPLQGEIRIFGHVKTGTCTLINYKAFYCDLMN